jgi:ubiquinone/menaquinone biosynthesis C-methylase UbiE
MSISTALHSTFPARLAKMLRRAAEYLDPSTRGVTSASTCVRFFDEFASQYDEGAAKAWPIKIYVSQEIEELERKFQSALVIGVGTGQELEPLLQSAIPHIEAIDVSENMLLEARKKYPDIIYHHADFRDFKGLRRQKYDLVICCGVLDYIDDLCPFMQKMASALSDDGVIMLTFTPVLHSHPTQRAETMQHPDYPEFRAKRQIFENFYCDTVSCGLSIHKCFTFNCYIDADPNLINICFFCILKK